MTFYEFIIIVELNNLSISRSQEIIIGVKCAPEEESFMNIERGRVLAQLNYIQMLITYIKQTR